MIFIFFPPPRPKKPTPTHPHRAFWATCHGIPMDSPLLPPPGPWKQSPTWNHDLGLHRCVWETQQNCHQKIHQAGAPPGRKNACQTVETNIVVSTNVGMDVRDDEEHVLRWRSPFSLKEWRRFWINFYCKIIFFHVGDFPCLVWSLFFGLRVVFFVPGLVFLLILQWSLQTFTVRKWKTFTSCWKLLPTRQREDWPQGTPADWQGVQPWSLGGHEISEGFYLFPICSSFFLKETKIIRWASTSKSS